MKKSLLGTLLVFSFLAVQSQSLDPAKKMLYYERYKSAINLLTPIVAADTKNAEAAYWLTESYLQSSKQEFAKAKAVLDKALSNNPGNGFLLAALGHIQIKENNPGAAKRNFLAAEGVAGKNAEILLAIARAAIEPKNDDSSYQYAVNILNKALTLKNVNKPQAYILLGNAYRKIWNGESADKNYRNALLEDPKYALANYRLGKLYETQKNYEIMLENYEDATKLDPMYAPAYLAMYDYYSYRDVDKAKEYLDKYIANTDADCQTALFAADYLFRAGKYNEALTKSSQLQAGACASEIGLRLKVLNAYCYERLKDSVNAKLNIESFMQQEVPDKIQVTDYEIAATIESKFVESEDAVIGFYNKIIEKDTTGYEKTKALNRLLEIYKKQNNPVQIAATLDRIYNFKPKPSNLDIYNRALAHMNILDYALADSLWQMYKEKYPEQIYGYTYRIKCNEALDTSMQLGLAVPHYEAMVAFAGKDTVKYKSQLVNSLYKLVVYYVNIKNDKPKAIDYLTQYLLFDPTNEEARKLLEKLQKANGS